MVAGWSRSSRKPASDSLRNIRPRIEMSKSLDCTRPRRCAVSPRYIPRHTRACMTIWCEGPVGIRLTINGAASRCMHQCLFRCYIGVCESFTPRLPIPLVDKLDMPECVRGECCLGIALTYFGQSRPTLKISARYTEVRPVFSRVHRHMAVPGSWQLRTSAGSLGWTAPGGCAPPDGSILAMRLPATLPKPRSSTSRGATTA